MLTLERLRNPSNEELAHFDLAAVDLACAVGLTGSEGLNIPACLAWVDHAVAWVRHQTNATFDLFRRNPETYENSEGIFRIVAIMSVLWRGHDAGGARALQCQRRPEPVGDGGGAADRRQLRVRTPVVKDRGAMVLQ